MFYFYTHGQNLNLYLFPCSRAGKVAFLSVKCASSACFGWGFGQTWSHLLFVNYLIYLLAYFTIDLIDSFTLPTIWSWFDKYYMIQNVNSITITYNQDLSTMVYTLFLCTYVPFMSKMCRQENCSLSNGLHSMLRWPTEEKACNETKRMQIEKNMQIKGKT